MPTALDIAANATGASVTEAQLKTWLTALRAALAEMGDPLARYGATQNCALSLTVAANALTIALKTRALADPDANNPVAIPFRNATIATGDYSVLDIIAAHSLVVPDTATLGTVNATPFRLWIVEFNDAGTPRLGVVNALSGVNIMALKDDAVYSSTAVGTGSDSAQVIYSGSAVTAKAMRILGYAEWSAGLATAGSWSSGPTKVQLFGPGVKLPGDVLQVQRVDTGAVATGITVTPDDDTIPLITEGDQYMSQAITPSSAANVLAVDARAHITHGANGIMCMALHQDAVANALKATRTQLPGVDALVTMTLDHRQLAASTSAITMRIRAGSAGAGTTTFNGVLSARKLGGVLASMLMVSEIMA